MEEKESDLCRLLQRERKRVTCGMQRRRRYKHSPIHNLVVMKKLKTQDHTGRVEPVVQTTESKRRRRKVWSKTSVPFLQVYKVMPFMKQWVTLKSSLNSSFGLSDFFPPTYPTINRVIVEWKLLRPTEAQPQRSLLHKVAVRESDRRSVDSKTASNFRTH